MSASEQPRDINAPSSSSEASSKSPNCGKCRNHGEIKPLKGHKRDCPFADCKCDSCILTVMRRRVMAEHTAHLKMKRAEAKSCEGGELQNHLDATPRPPSVQEANLQFNKLLADLELKRYEANELIKLFDLQMDALPFAYAVLNVSGDLPSAIDMITEVSRELFPAIHYLEGRAGPSVNCNADPNMNRKENNGYQPFAPSRYEFP